MENIELIKVAFDTSLEGIILTDKNAEIVMANKAIDTILGYKKSELIGRDITIFMPSFLREIHSQHHQTYVQNHGFSHLENAREVTGLHKNGNFISLEIRLSLFEFGGEKYVKALFSDISRRKERDRISQITKMKLEAKVKDYTQELEKVVEELQNTNKVLKVEIQKKVTAKQKAKKALIVERELSQLKTNFISLASHEFRTPLSGIITSATLISKHSDPKNTSVSKHVSIIKSMVKHLNNILDDFLSLELVESGKTRHRYSSFMFNDLIEEIIEEAKAYTKKGQTIHYTPCKECPKMHQDRKIVSVIITNILYNAIKYSFENSSIEIAVNTREFIKIKIRDYGIGIPLKDQKYLFKRFFRGSNTSHIQGTGIGLNIVKANIENLGGSISFTSKEIQGTTFEIKFPKAIKSTINNQSNKNEEEDSTN